MKLAKTLTKQALLSFAVCGDLSIVVPQLHLDRPFGLPTAVLRGDRQADTCTHLPATQDGRKTAGWADTALPRISREVRLELPGTKPRGARRYKSFCLSGSKWRGGMPSAAAWPIWQISKVRRYNLMN